MVTIALKKSMDLILGIPFWKSTNTGLVTKGELYNSQTGAGVVTPPELNPLFLQICSQKIMHQFLKEIIVGSH